MLLIVVLLAIYLQWCYVVELLELSYLCTALRGTGLATRHGESRGVTSTKPWPLRIYDYTCATDGSCCKQVVSPVVVLAVGGIFVYKLGRTHCHRSSICVRH